MKVKKALLSLIVSLFAFCSLFAFAACGEKDTQKKIESIAINPATVTIEVGDELSFGDFTLTVTYDDKSTDSVTLAETMFSAEDLAKLDKAGTYTLTVMYQGKSTTLTVNVNEKTPAEKTVKSIAVSPASAVIPVGSSLNFAAHKVIVTYEGDTTEEIALTESMISAEDLAKLSAVGSYELTVNYKEKTAVLAVEVTKEVASISLSKSSVTLAAGDSLPYSEIKVTVTYSDESTAEVALTESMFAAADLEKLNVVGNYEFTVTYLEKTTSLSVTVNERTIHSIAVDPTSVTIAVGDKIDYSSVKVILTYDNETTGEVALAESMISAEDLAKLSKRGEYEITVTYKDKTATLRVNVTAEIVSLALKQSAVEINVGDDLDYDALKITVTYSDESVEEVAVTEEMFNMSELGQLADAGEYELTVQYMGTPLKLNVTVNKLTMNLTIADVTATYSGNAVTVSVTGTPTGAKVSIVYYAGSEVAEANRVESVVNAGDYIAVVTVTADNYNDFTKTVNIKVNKAVFDTSKLVWKNTNYPYTAQEITLNPTVEGLLDGMAIDTIRDENGNVPKATESGIYTAIVTFTNTNPNYTIESFTLTWSITESGMISLEKWFGAQNGELLTAVFTTQEDDRVAFTFGEDTLNNLSIAYDGDGNATVDVTGTAYTSIATENGVLTIVKGNETYVLITESRLERFAGEYSTVAEDFVITFDETAATATLTTTVKGEAAIVRNLSLTDDNGTVKLTVADSDMFFSYSADYKRVKLEGYKNPANFDQVYDSDKGLWLASKVDVDAYLKSMPVGSFISYDGSNVFTVNADKTVAFNGDPVQLYMGYFKKYSFDSDVKFMCLFDAHTNRKGVEVVAKDNYFEVTLSSSSEVFVPVAHKEYYGTYYMKDAEGLHSNIKLQFVAFSGYYGIDISGAESGNGKYKLDEGNLTLATTADGLTATLKLETGETFTVTFGADGLATLGGNSYQKVDRLIATPGYYGNCYVNGAGEIVKYDNSNATFTIGSKTSQDFAIKYLDNGDLQITVTVEGEQKVIVYSADTRYITMDNVLYVYSDLASVSNGRATDTYYNGEETISYSTSSHKYTVKLAGAEQASELTDVVYSIVDDGNNKGRTVIQVTGKINDVEYTITHYSLAVIKLNKSVFVAENFAAIFGSEFKPTVDSEDVFRFNTDGKMTFRGTEIFLNSARSYTNFYLKTDKNTICYSFDIQKTNIRFNDYIDWNIPYYFSAYFDFSGAYLSEDGTKALYFDENKIYYHNGTREDSSDRFSIVPNATGATITISNKTAEFTKVAGGVHTMTYDEVNYTKVTSFNMNDYYGTYTCFDGTVSGKNVNFVPGTSGAKSVSVFIVYNGAIVPVLDSSFDSGVCLVKNPDAATSSNLPVLALERKYLNLIGTTKLDGKDFVISMKAVQKEASTQYVTSVVATFDGTETALIFKNFSICVELNDILYQLKLNADEDTKAKLPVLVFESWWDEFDSYWTYNGNRVELAIGVGGTSENPVSALIVTYKGEAVENTRFEAVEGGRKLTFTQNGVNYIGIMGGTPSVAVYSEAEFNFFFAENDTNTVGGKPLVLPAQPTNSKTTFDLTEATFDGKAITSATYLYADTVIIFITEDGSFAYDVTEKKFWSEVIEGDPALIGLEVKSGASYGSPLYYTSFVSEFGDFNKETGKVSLIYKMGGSYSLSSATVEKKSDGVYLVTGKNYYNEDIVAVLLLDGENKSLVSAEEYMFAGTHSIGADETIVIEKTANGYTAKYKGDTGVSITPDFKARKFILTEGANTYMISWTFTDGEFVFAISPVSAEILAFEGYGYAYTNVVSGYYDYELTVSFAGMNSSNVAEFTIAWEMGSSRGTETGTLSANGKYITAKINRNNVVIFKNAISDEDTEFIMLTSGSAVKNLIGSVVVEGLGTVEIGVGAESEYDEDDYFDGIGSARFVVRVDGNRCTGVSSFSASATEIEFTYGGKTYTATYAEGAVTVTEKAA